MSEEYVSKEVFEETMKRMEVIFLEQERRYELTNQKRDEIFAMHMTRLRDYIDAKLSGLSFILALIGAVIALIEYLK